jgi:hypothetical protein
MNNEQVAKTKNASQILHACGKYVRYSPYMMRNLATTHTPIRHYELVHNHGEESSILHRTLVFFSMFDLQYSTQDQVTAE